MPENALTRRAVVLLPTYNEMDNLPRIVPAILEAAPVDVLVIDDSSPDGTGALADTIAAAHSRVHVLHRLHKTGLGAAYIAGFRWALEAGYGHIIQMDADFSHPPTQLGTMLSLGKIYDLVLGSRWVAGGGTKNWPISRQIISRAGSFYARMWLGLPIRDLTGGFKCFRRDVLAHMDLDAIHSRGYAFQIEVTYQAMGLGYRVHEMPITFVERVRGRSKMNRSIFGEATVGVPMLRLQRRH